MAVEIITGDALIELSRFPDDLIDLAVTSPPYDNLRKYAGFNFDFEGIAQQLFRVTKQGGVVVWVVADATTEGSETGTSFRQALYFKEIGFNLHDTMIYKKEPPPLSHNRYEQHFEFMFVLSKGRPKTFNGLREPSKNAGRRRTGSMRQDSDALNSRNAKGVVSETKLLGNVWELTCASGGTGDKFAHEHPAIFPEELARRHILSWSNEGDLILDPFCGSGTVGKIAILLNRSFKGIDISVEYCDLTKRRIRNVLCNESRDGDLKASPKSLHIPPPVKTGGLL